MLTVLLCALAGLIEAFHVVSTSPNLPNRPNNVFEWVFIFVSAVVLGALPGGLVGLGLSYLLGILFPKKWFEYKHELVSLRGSEGTQGRFFLGSGSIGQGEYYFYYEKSGAGYAPGKIMIDNNVTVYEEEREDGQMVVFVRHFVWWTQVRLFANWPREWRYEFHIPKGTLKQEFHLG
jgi:hypothetical protein